MWQTPIHVAAEKLPVLSKQHTEINSHVNLLKSFHLRCSLQLLLFGCQKLFAFYTRWNAITKKLYLFFIEARSNIRAYDASNSFQIQCYSMTRDSTNIFTHPLCNILNATFIVRLHCHFELAYTPDASHVTRSPCRLRVCVCVCSFFITYFIAGERERERLFFNSFQPRIWSIHFLCLFESHIFSCYIVLSFSFGCQRKYVTKNYNMEKAEFTWWIYFNLSSNQSLVFDHICSCFVNFANASHKYMRGLQHKIYTQ